jgi:hypothetical protein
MKTLAPILALTLAACGSSPPPVKKATCDAGFCGTVCCGDGTTCINDALGDPVCSVLCTYPTDCMTGDAGSCCMPVLVNGDYKGQSICAPQPSGANAYKCTCHTTSDCGSNECAPLIGDSTGVISGPYVCLPNDGENHDGCGVSTSCFASPQYCATDMNENQFCSAQCTTDSDCGNPNVACCNAKCHQPGDMCCGLCGH